MPRYKVKCDCPTPLAENPAEVEADDAREAKEEFFKLNGISDTSWPLSIDEVGGVAAKKANVKKDTTPTKK